MTRANRKKLAENLKKARAAKAAKRKIEKAMAEVYEQGGNPEIVGPFDVLPDDDWNPRAYIRDWVRREVEAALKELLT